MVKRNAGKPLTITGDGDSIKKMGCDLEHWLHGRGPRKEIPSPPQSPGHENIRSYDTRLQTIKVSGNKQQMTSADG